MKNTSIILLAVFLAACGNDTDVASKAPGSSSSVTADESAAQKNSVVKADLVDGIQVVEIEVDSAGYSPNRIAVEAGTPVRLVFTRTSDASCIDSVAVPAYGVKETPLPLGEATALEFTPEKSGEFTFVCGMEMVKGTMVVWA